jgi:hypothetical protein
MNKNVCLLVLGLLAATVALADDSLNVRFIGGANTPGTTYSIAVAGTHAYIGACEGGLRVLDISNPASPFETGSWASADYARGLAVSGDYVYVACGHSGLRVIDVSSPSSPTEVGAYGVLDYAWAVVVVGNYAYVADEEAGLCIVSITDPRNPVFVGVCDTPGYAMSVSVSGDYAYVADLSGGLRVIDASNIQIPVEVGYYVTPDLAYRAAVSGDYVYMGDLASLRVINVSNPASPTEVGFLSTPSAPLGVAVVGNLAYLCEGSSGLHVTDVSNPAAPADVGLYYGPVINGVAVSGPYIYCATGTGLGIFQYYGAGIEERTAPDEPRIAPAATIVRSSLILPAVSGERSAVGAALLDISGRRVLNLKPGANDVSRLEAGVYFVRGQRSGVREQGEARKVVVQH